MAITAASPAQMLLLPGGMYCPLKPRVLCVDDEPMIGNFVREVLEQTGRFHVESATKVIDAIAKAHLFRPDIFVIDINMPGRNGISLAREIRAEPWLRHRPILFFSGVSEKAQEALKAGGNGPTEFLTKGVPAKKIVETVERLTFERLKLHRDAIPRRN